MLIVISRIVQTASLIILLTTTVAAQGTFLEQDQSGLGLEGGTLWNNTGRGGVGVVGYSFRNVEFAIGLESFRKDGHKISDQALLVGLGVLARPKKNVIPLGLAVRLGYGRTLSWGEPVDIFSFGASVYRNQNLTSMMFIQPRIGFVGTCVITTGVRNFDMSSGFDGSLSLAFKSSSRFMILVGPGWAYNTEAKISVWNFSIGIILITKK